MSSFSKGGLQQVLFWNGHQHRCSFGSITPACAERQDGLGTTHTGYPCFARVDILAAFGDGSTVCKTQRSSGLGSRVAVPFSGTRNKEFNKYHFVRRKYSGLIMPGMFLVLCGTSLAFLFAQCEFSS